MWRRRDGRQGERYDETSGEKRCDLYRRNRNGCLPTPPCNDSSCVGKIMLRGRLKVDGIENQRHINVLDRFLSNMYSDRSLTGVFVHFQSFPYNRQENATFSTIPLQLMSPFLLGKCQSCWSRLVMSAWRIDWIPSINLRILIERKSCTCYGRIPKGQEDMLCFPCSNSFHHRSMFPIIHRSPRSSLRHGRRQPGQGPN